MRLHLPSMLFPIVAIAHFTYASPLPEVESSTLSSSHPTQIMSRANTNPHTILVSFKDPGPPGTIEDEAVTNMVELLFEDANEATKGLIPPVNPTYKNHIETGRKTITLVAFSFTGLDICKGECTAVADAFQKVSWIKNSAGKTLYKQK